MIWQGCGWFILLNLLISQWSSWLNWMLQKLWLVDSYIFSIFVFCFSSVTVFALVFVFIVIHSHIHFIWHVCGNCVHFPNWIESHLEWQSPPEQFKQLDFRNRFYYFRIIDCNLFKEFVIDHPGCNLRMIISRPGISSSCHMFSTLSHRKTPFWKTPSRTAPSVEYIPQRRWGWSTMGGAPCSGIEKAPRGANGRDRAWFHSNCPAETEKHPKMRTLCEAAMTQIDYQNIKPLSDDQNSGVLRDRVSFFLGPKLIYLQVYSLTDEITSAKPRVLSSKLVELVLGGILPPCLFTKSVPLLRLYWIKWWNILNFKNPKPYLLEGIP